MRPFEAAHLPDAAALCQLEIAYLPFSPAILQERILDDPDFDPDLNPTVWQGERLVGLACGAPPSEELQTAGGVKLFAVAGDMRRQGIATRLFDHFEDRLTSLGAAESLAIIAGNNRFMQGLDLRYTEALCFLEARGYERAGDGMDMDVDLRSTPLDTSAKEEELERDHGLRVRRVTMDDYDRAWEYVAREFEYPSALATAPVGTALGLPGDLRPETRSAHPVDGRAGRRVLRLCGDRRGGAGTPGADGRLARGPQAGRGHDSA